MCNQVKHVLSHPKYFVILQTKQLILKCSISALNKLNVEFLLDFVQKEDMQNLL